MCWCRRASSLAAAAQQLTACTRADCPSEGCRRQCYLHSSQSSARTSNSCCGTAEVLRTGHHNEILLVAQGLPRLKIKTQLNLSVISMLSTVSPKKRRVSLFPHQVTPPPPLQRPPLPGGRQRDDVGPPLASHPTQTHTTTSPF